MTDRDNMTERLEGMEWIEKYGVRFFDHEDDWGWTILGTPPSRRILAAINWLARDYGVTADLRESIIDGGLDAFEFRTKVAVNVRECDEAAGYFTWDWVEPEFTGAGPTMTVVTLS